MASKENRYEIKELLGEGGMGVVYRALDKRTNSYVALKTLRDATDPAMLEMFKREWALLGEVPHPNIVDVRDVDEIEENGVRKPCFIMPLLPGCTLAALIKSSSPRLTTEFVVNMVTQVCKGLQAAHEKDLIHRDLKPSNIFIMEDDTAKIIDFGLVHAIGQQSSTGLKGTWQYMAPEQIEGSKQPNRSFDIFSLGVVAYEALTGHQPFKRGKFEDTVDAVRFFVPQAISERNPKVPQMVSKAIHIAMAKQPGSRYATAREFAETLQKAYRNEYIERFDPAKIRPRVDRAKKAFTLGDSDFASEILTELEAEGNLDTDITLLRSQIDEYNKQKRVRQLFEAAQTRLEQEEIPLALEKLQEILKIDPQNNEAIKLRRKIEEQRSQQQVGEWLDLARKHLERHDFSEARRALKEVFNLKYDDPEAARLKAQVDAREKEVESARSEKEQLYSNALRHNQNGEISSALSKLEKLLDLSRNTPGASVPERDKVFQAFYNDVHTEKDRIEKAYADGTRHLSEKNFEKALGICDGILYRYPQNPQFQALRLKVEHSQRQDLSAYIAEVGRAVETEPNLDRRVGHLEEACKRYPQEAQFSRQLGLAKELRDLVQSIVDRARNYEEQSQFAEAITQWNTLANIHPQYPGIDFEINQLERRREQQTQEDKKSNLVEKIDRALGNAAYADAERLSNEGLSEFPGNPELTALLRLSRQGLEQSREATRLFEEAKAHRVSGDWDQAVSLLRQSLDLDKRNIVVQNTLVNLLTERAHAMLDTDLASAEPLAAEAGRLDPEHPSVHRVIDLIAQSKRKQYVEQTVLQARELQNVHRNQAIDILKQGLSVYPNDGRLQQTLTNLQMDEPRPSPPAGGGMSGGASMFGKPQVEDVNTVVYPNGGGHAPTAPPVKPPPVAKPPAKPSAPPPVKQEKPKTPEPPRGPSKMHQAGEAGVGFLQNIKARLGSGSHGTLVGVVLGLLASGLVIGFLSWYFNQKSTPVQTPKKIWLVTVDTTPNDATVTVDGTPLSASARPRLDEGTVHKVSVSRLGYKTQEEGALAANGSTWKFALEPEPLQISISVAAKTASVFLDDQKQPEDVAGGSWSSSIPVKSSQEHHTLVVKSPTGAALFKIDYDIAAGKVATLAPLQTKDLIVTSSLGKDATVYSGDPASKLVLPNQDRKDIPQDGVILTGDQISGSLGIANGAKVDPLAVVAGAAPVLGITLNATSNSARATISVNVPNAQLSVANGLMPKPRNGTWTWLAAPGTYAAKLTAPGMEDLSFSIELARGGQFTQRYMMKAKPVVVISPQMSILLIKDGEPGATIKVDDAAVGALDSAGNGRFPVVPGKHPVQLSKPGYISATFYGQTFQVGRETELKGANKRLTPAGSEKGTVRIVSLVPAQATVTYAPVGDPQHKTAIDSAKAASVPAGTYEFTADAPHYISKSYQVKIEANKSYPLSFALDAVKETVITFVDPTLVNKENGDWYHGKSNHFIPLLTRFKTNTLLLSSQRNARKMTWRVFLDDNNVVTYTLDSKGGLVIDHLIDGSSTRSKQADVDLTSTSAADSAYATQIKLEKDLVVLGNQNGTRTIDVMRDSRHDWSRAKIEIKGDNYFTFWPGH